MSGEEVVLTSRRALWRSGTGPWASGRLRISDRCLRLTAGDGSSIEVAVAALDVVHVVRWPRPTVVLATADGPLQVRCFAAPAVAALLFS
jgi:hypothetical protein